jgi:hypothetical protein
MMQPRIRAAAALLFGLSSIAGIGSSQSFAQAAAETGPPATLRLTQVSPRLPAIHLYAIAQDQDGTPIGLQPDELVAVVGANNVPVDIVPNRAGIAIVFLIDVSLSLSNQQFEWIKAAVLAWIDSLKRDDRAAIVTLGSTVRMIQDFTGDKQALSAAIKPLAPHDRQTLLYQGLVQAIDLSRRLDPALPLRRAIVTLTDGMDDQKGGAGRQEVIDKLQLDPTPIYGIGASAVSNAKVDMALKDFAGLVRVSGGDFRAVDLQTLNKGYFDLRKIVNSTVHITANCPAPACVPDGTAAVIRLVLSQGNQRLTSASVTARMVGSDGRVAPPVHDVVYPVPPPAPAPAPAPPPPTPAVQVATEPPATPASSPPPVYSDKSDSRWFPLNINIRFFLNAPLQWGSLAALMLATGGFGVHRLVRIWHFNITPPPPPAINIWNVQFGRRVAIEPGTQLDKRRLRLDPLGRNDLAPVEALFQDKLTVGRSPDSDICIGNDSQVSGTHCSLAPDGKFILVRDEGSRNGTRLNGVPVNGFIHAESDSILGAGRTEMRIKLLEPGTS